MHRDDTVSYREKASAVPQTPLSALRRFISRLRLFPKTPNFFTYFERSGENIVEGTRLLCKMMEGKQVCMGLLEQLKGYEHTGDQITHDVINLLHQTFLTPFDRLDIHTLAVKMDDVLDIAYYVGNRMARYEVAHVPQEMIELAEILCRATEEIAQAVHLLKDMRNSQVIIGHCRAVKRLEYEADEKVNIVIEKIFRDNSDPRELIKIKELVENLEAAADKCEDVANIIEQIILRNA